MFRLNSFPTPSSIRPTIIQALSLEHRRRRGEESHIGILLEFP